MNRFTLTFLFFVLMTGGCSDSQEGGNVNESNSETSEQKEPLVHRAQPIVCEDSRPAVNHGDCDPAACEPEEVCPCLCTADADCTDGENGRCEFVYDERSECSYDECFEDSDCGSGRGCFCDTGFDQAGSVATRNRGVGGDCVVDSDCSDGAYCSPSISPCGEYEFRCHTSNDDCVDDADCDDPERCAYFGDLGRWSCTYTDDCQAGDG